MHDLDRSDLVFESDGFDARLEELYDNEVGPESEAGVFDEVEQTELAGELLSVTGDHELDHFFGKFISNALNKVRKALPDRITQKLGGYLKGAVKASLPALAGFAGGAIGGPAGAMLASKASPYLGSLLGLELEGLSSEDQEFEAAKQLIRFAGNAIENAANAAPGTPPEAAARLAVIEAARRHAPGLVRATAAGGRSPSAQQGTWRRHGNKIVLFGV